MQPVQRLFSFFSEFRGSIGKNCSLTPSSRKRENMAKLTPLVLLLMFVTALVAPSAAHAAPTGAGKFHVVYLVSAVDLKPGARVTVDPVFLSDGREVMGFQGYCLPKTRSVVAMTERGLLDDYCAKKPFTLNTRNYVVLNNHGQQLELDEVRFTIVGETHNFERPEERDPVILGQGAIRSFSSGTVEPPNWPRRDGAPEYFFFMSKDKALLEKIVPVAEASPAVVGALAKRAVEFSEIAKGRFGSRRNSRDIDKAPVCYAPNPITEFRLENPLVGDIDLDGKQDLLVNVYSVHKLESEANAPLVACFTKYEILGNGETYLWGSHQEPLSPWGSHTGRNYQQLVGNGYAPQTYMLFVRLNVSQRSCLFRFSYLITQGMPHPAGYNVQPFGAGCGYGYSFLKQKPAIDDVQ